MGNSNSRTCFWVILSVSIILAATQVVVSYYGLHLVG